MKNRFNSGNWPLLVLMGAVFMLLALIPREIALRHGFDKTIGNVVFISSIGIFIFIYAIIVEVLTVFFNWLFRQFGAKAQTQSQHEKPYPVSEEKDSLIIDYASKRKKTISRQEARAIALEEKIIEYVCATMSELIPKSQLEMLVDYVAEFIHSTVGTVFNERPSIVTPEGLTTTDLMHFGWNIAKPLRKPCTHTASFLKAVFADAFRNTELYTIEKKLRLNPMQGTIKIDPDICSLKPMAERSQSPMTVSAKDAAMADMRAEDMELADSLGDEEFVA